MTNDEIPNDERMPKSEARMPLAIQHPGGRSGGFLSSFEPLSSLVIGNSSFVRKRDGKVALSN
jgi:hypothetical protein